ncbi:hypothetical protein [Aeromonas caviae]|uniref:hypothetical protein n=1 Tax=Aeromonas caviae TaxID=648 RepID=UPI00398D21D8
MNILRQIDNLRIFEQPYHDHYAADKDEVTRSHYVALLLMVLLSEGTISEQQQRMLDFWLPSIGLADRQAELCKLAERLAKDQLGDAIKLLKQDPCLIRGLLLDSMIFSRIDKPLTESVVSLVEALAGFFALKEQELGNIVYLAAFILGLPTEAIDEPYFDMDLLPYQGWGEFLYHYRPNAARRLFKWADDNKIPTNILPRNIGALANVKQLNNEGYKVNDSVVRWDSLPEELYLLSGLESLSIKSEKLKNPCQYREVEKFKNLIFLEFQLQDSAQRIV